MKNILISDEWIPNKIALKITSRYPRAPHNEVSLVSAGKKGNFIRKSFDEIHWEYKKDGLIEYCEISNQPTLLGIAQSLKTSVGIIKYLALKNNIPFEEKMNRKYLTIENCEKLMKIYEEHLHGKNKKV